MKIHYLPTMLVAALLLTGCNVNKDISVPDHAHVSGSSTINGEISVGTGAVVNGGLRTINGRIDVASGAQTGNLTTINGGITLADGVHAGQLQSVNGGLTLDKNATATSLATVNGDISVSAGTHVASDAETVNGTVALCNAQVDGNLSVYNGTVLITDGATVHRDVVVKKPTHGYQENPERHQPIVIIGPHATVDGSISFEQPGQLYVNDSAVIHDVRGVTAVKFSGDAPAGVRLPACPAN